MPKKFGRNGTLNRGKLDMWNKVKRLMKSLCRQTSGNVMIIFAAGAPVFIGGAGLAVDTAQWYMWKREMQYAVDQAAMAGAWSRVGGTTGIEFKTRAQQELTANLQVVDFQGTPAISLADYAGQSKNSVKVTLSATRALPFSKMVKGTGTTITVSAQAAFEKASTFKACLIAVDPSTKGAISFGGNAYVVARCGVAALSNNAEAIVNNGSGTFNVKYLVAAGGIDADLIGTFTDPNTGLPYTNTGFENQSGLVDPFGELTPPNNPEPRTYSCASTTSYTANFTNTTVVEEWTYTAATQAGLATATPTKRPLTSATQTGSEATDAATQVNKNPQNPATPWVDHPINPTVTTVADSPAVPASGCNNGGNNCTNPGSPATAASYKRIDRVTTTTHWINSISTTSSPSIAAMKPGTYSDFTVGCDTTMLPGVYVISGGGFTVHSQYSVRSLKPDGTSGGVMIVLKNGASLDINGGSTLNLRAMDTQEMIGVGISESEALKLRDMLIFEDRNSSGSNGAKLNGNAGALLTGTIYLPKSSVTFNGSFGVTSGCLVIAAKTIAIGGTANMSTFCHNVDDGAGGVAIGGGVASVRLVA